MNISCYDSPIGRLTVCADKEALVCLDFVSDDRNIIENLEKYLPGIERREETNAVLDELFGQLDEYFNGKRREFNVPLKLYGTTFQMAVWAGLMQIPYGKTVSYSRLAAMIGKPKSVRAVGGANHNNPISILVPCHRVIGSSGKLTGYGGGLDKKEFLINLERTHFPG